MKARDAPFPSVVVEASCRGAAVQGFYRGRRECPEGHGRDVEQRGRVGPEARGAPDEHAVLDVVRRHGEHAVVGPFVALGVDVAPRAERARVRRALGPLVDRRAHRAVEGHGAVALVRLDEVLLDLGPDGLEHVAEVDEHGEVAPQSRGLLFEVRPPDGPVGGRAPAHEERRQNRELVVHGERPGRDGGGAQAVADLLEDGRRPVLHKVRQTAGDGLHRAGRRRRGRERPRLEPRDERARRGPRDRLHLECAH
mmetsp:Transcript_20783/g.62008  ORF Transcript_20783/g.62008 Transcript_20783/m.62008 type:complete len:253 (-) Transcript_20783:188-946(-)